MRSELEIAADELEQELQKRQKVVQPAPVVDELELELQQREQEAVQSAPFSSSIRTRLLKPALVVTAAMEELIRRRDAARLSRDWATADTLREELRALGWKPQDKSSGPEASGESDLLLKGTLLHKTAQAKRKVLKTIEVRGDGIYSKAKKGKTFHLLQAQGDGTTPIVEEECGFSVRDSTFFFIGEDKDDEAAQLAWIAALKKCGFVAA